MRFLIIAVSISVLATGASPTTQIHPRRGPLLRYPRLRLAQAWTLKGGDTQSGLQNPTPTSRAQLASYLRTGSMPALAVPRGVGHTTKK